MIVLTMWAMLDDAITRQQLLDHHLYLAGDGETRFSISQALNPVERLESYLGLRWRRFTSRFGERFEASRVDLLE